MPIICQLCKTEFKKIIPWQHLAQHNISTSTYKEKFGSLYSQETLDKFISRVPHNKGIKITDPIELANHKERINKREERYKSGEFTRGTAKTAEQKQVLSNRSIDYAAANPEKMQLRAAKAVETKIKKGYDFGSNMRGKRHSDAARTKIKESASARVQQKTIDSDNNIITKLHELDLTLINNVCDHKLQLSCNVCNTIFSFTKQYFTPAKFKRSMCPGCYPRTIKQSKGEIELFNFVQTLLPSAIAGYREKYHSKEIDIFIPELNLGIEFNGLYWHSESTLLANNQSPTTDFEKQKMFTAKGIRIIQVFEDEWEHKSDIVKSRLTNILGNTSTNIYARKCQVREVSSKEASIFCEQNHLMGKGRSNLRFGLYHNNTLVSLMTFTNNNLSRKLVGVWEINRFASLLDTTIIGGASKLFKYFLKHTSPATVVSYADNRWSTGELYKQLGFEKISNGVPNYWYLQANIIKRLHRFALRKNKNDDQSLTEAENRRMQGYLRIWDSGSSKWTWTRK
jgi:hypothetical protein